MTASEVVVETQERILNYLKNPTQGQKFGHLMAVFEFKFNERVDGVSMSRILDRALQKLRKAGKVTFTPRRGWVLT
jgi:hypothetical protein